MNTQAHHECLNCDRRDSSVAEARNWKGQRVYFCPTCMLEARQRGYLRDDEQHRRALRSIAAARPGETVTVPGGIVLHRTFGAGAYPVHAKGGR